MSLKEKQEMERKGKKGKEEKRPTKGKGEEQNRTKTPTKPFAPQAPQDKAQLGVLSSYGREEDNLQDNLKAWTHSFLEEKT